MELPGTDITAPRRKVYPRHVRGRFRTLRTVFSVMLQGLLFLIPWLQWDGRQAILADVPGRKLFLFGLVLHPQDTYFLHLLLISAAITLFLVSAVAGRMWCGYACPQTIFTQAFIMVERWFEGDRAARIRLDRSPWNAEKVVRKLGKRAAWCVMGGWLGLTFAGYFLPIREIVGQLLSGQVSTSTAVAVAFFTAISLFDFGYFREQFCCYLCPYARFQGAMLDSNSLIVGYDARRGEPRGKLKDPDRGSCIDCGMCVQVCPTGIDIRKGLQLECIACSACVDACDEVMDKIQQPRGLVRYSSLNGLEGKPTGVLRPRVALYSLLLLGLGSLLTYLIWNRSPLGVDAIRVVPPGGQLAATTPDGRISNVFKVNLINRMAESEQVWLETEGLEGAEIVGLQTPVELQGGQVFEAQVLVLVPQNGKLPRGSHAFRFQAHNQKDLKNSKESTFFIP
jgi:cytochrome c oxidase accessory protein FixG